MVKAMLRAALSGLLLSATPALPHSIYTDVRGKDGQICCGGSDCAETIYRENGGAFEFLTRERHWVAIPQEMITFLPIPGDRPDGPSHRAHLCYRAEHDGPEYEQAQDSRKFTSGDGLQEIHLYCAFIPPGGV